MSLVTAGRAHIRPSRRTYLAFGWYALEFAGPPVVIGIDSPISIHPIGSRISGLFGTRFFYATHNSSLCDDSGRQQRAFDSQLAIRL